MAEWHPTLDKVMTAFSDGKPKTHRDVVKETGLGEFAVHTALYNYWKKGPPLSPA